MSQQDYRRRIRDRLNTPDVGAFDPTFSPGLGVVTKVQQDKIANNEPPPAPPEPKEQIDPAQAGDVPPVTQQSPQTVEQAHAGAEEAIAKAAQPPELPELQPGMRLDRLQEGAAQEDAEPEDASPAVDPLHVVDRSVETNRPVAEVDAEEAAAKLEGD